MQHSAVAPRIRWRVFAWGLVGTLWLAPLVAMGLSAQWQWGLEDFLYWSALLGAAGVGLEAVQRALGNGAFRCAAGLSILLTLMLVYLNAAVGLIGSDGDVANWLILAVPMAGLAVAAASQFRPAGMIRAMLTMAAVQSMIAALVHVAALAPRDQPPKHLVLSGGFVLAWLGCAWLFGRAAPAVNQTGRDA